MKLQLALVLILAGVQVQAQTKPVDVTFKPADRKNVFVFARLYRASGPAKGVVLMFHQARSNMAEYEPIAPRVAKLGFDCLTVDQRAGGTMWGAQNQTVAQYNAIQEYLAAYPDMVGALNWAKAKKYKKILAWGSSYSASLTLRLAAEHPEIAAVLVFSPGEYFDKKGVVAGWNKKVKVPALFSFTQEETIQGGHDLYETAGPYPGRKNDVLVTHKQGVHGSSTLRADQNPNSNGYYWGVVETFLKRVAK